MLRILADDAGELTGAHLPGISRPLLEILVRTGMAVKAPTRRGAALTDAGRAKAKACEAAARGAVEAFHTKGSASKGSA